MSIYSIFVVDVFAFRFMGTILINPWDVKEKLKRKVGKGGNKNEEERRKEARYGGGFHSIYCCILPLCQVTPLIIDYNRLVRYLSVSYIIEVSGAGIIREIRHVVYK